jgi:LmbE family N-acetylglucosaminyl deacetylase
MANRNVLVITAHPDDEVFGVGGTIAQFVKQDKKVTVVCFSYGEKSHIWLKKNYTAKMRKAEAAQARKILGYKNEIFLRVDEGEFLEKSAKVARDRLKSIIRRKKPDQIFTHSSHDPHEDHRAINRIVRRIVDQLGCTCDVYTFDVWNVINLRRRDYPLLYVDISDTFRKKIQALRCFKSQWSSIVPLIGFVYARAIINGLNHDVRFAEKFYKIK